jgi:2-oxoisovalerate dehydrogenase E1 component
MSTPDLDPLGLYRTMATVRRFDARVRAGLASGEFVFNYWPVEGQEAIGPAVCANLTSSDSFVTTYRCAGDSIAKGVPLRELMSELLGRADGTSKGKGGAMGINWPEAGLAATTGIVGAGPPIANGLALASQLRGQDGVTVVSFGDGATSIGAVHEAMNLAGVWKLPVVFLCQNNLFGEGTLIHEYTATERFSDRAAGYGFEGETVDGKDALAVYEAARRAVEAARAGEGPRFLEAVAQRTQGHYFGDGMPYADKEKLAEARAHEPVAAFRARLIEEGRASAEELDGLEAEVQAEVDAAVESAVKSAGPEASELYVDVYAGRNDDGSLATGVRAEPIPSEPAAEQNMAGAIRQGLDQVMARDESVVLLGEDVHDPVGGMFTVTQGLSTKYGRERVRPTPIAETSIVGASIGAAIGGLRPVAELMFFDFLGVCLDQLANHAAKLRYMTGGRARVPMVLRTVEGAQSGPQHSQALEAWLMHTPGLKVVWPSTPADAKGLILSAIEDDDPVVYIESMAMFFDPTFKAMVPEAEDRVPIGLADRRREGSDVTLVSYGTIMPEALAAAEALAEEGVGVEVIDLRSLLPLDLETVLGSVGKTKRLVIAHSATRFCGPGAEIAAAVSAELHGELAAPVARVGGTFTPVPRAAELEALHSPRREAIASALRGVLA